MFFRDTILLVGLFLLSNIVDTKAGWIASREEKPWRGRSMNPEVDFASDGGLTVSYSPNWGGLMYSMGNNTFTTVTGTFTAPTPSGSPGSAAVWVGIDGYDCNALFQTGISVTLSDDGTVSYGAWYQWLPNSSHSMDELEVNSGDEIQLFIHVTSPTTGTATIYNLTTRKSASRDVTSTTPLCEESADWIVEDYTVNGQQVPLVDFGTVIFTDALAGPGDYNSSGANNMIVMVDSNFNSLTDVSFINDTAFSIQYL